MPNPKDSTLRNIQAANKKIAKLEDQIKFLKSEIKRLDKMVRSHDKVISDAWRSNEENSV